MTTARGATYDLLRDLGMTTVFGNPGSTEESFLTGFPADFRYILGLHEAVVVSMADGFAQASGNATFVNLHTATGVGNSMGSLFTAWCSRAPLVVVAGQQTRQMLAIEPWLVNRQAAELPRPYVKWSHEPARPEDVPGAIERAYHIAMAPPRGPAFVSIPMDDWDAPAAPRQARRVASRSHPDEGALAAAAAALAAASSPMLVVGGGVDRANGWDAAVRLAERLNAPVWEAPAPDRASFPQTHPLFQGTLTAGMKPLAERLAGHDVVLVVGAAVFRYHAYVPGPILPPETRLFHITDDPDEAARAPVGAAIVGDPRVALERLADLLPAASRAVPPARPAPAAAAATDPITPPFVMSALAAALPPNAVVVEESPSTRIPFYDQIRIASPGSYFATASGGLGFALPAAVGVGLARPEAAVACIVGDGAALFGIQAIWSAARYDVPVVYIVLNNGGYSVLKAFAAFQQTPGVPGLDLPGIDFVAIARGFGADAHRVTCAADLADACREAFRDAEVARRPVLLEIMVDTAVPALLGDASR